MQSHQALGSNEPTFVPLGRLLNLTYESLCPKSKTTMRIDYEALGRLAGSDERGYSSRVAGVLKEKGYVIRRTGRGSDRGVNLIAQRGATRIAVICKYHSKRVGASDVQRCHGAAAEVKASEAWIVSYQGFTEDAKECARAIRIRLLDNVTLCGLPVVSKTVVIAG